jgi:serine/threonine-protein kinase
MEKASAFSYFFSIYVLLLTCYGCQTSTEPENDDPRMNQFWAYNYNIAGRATPLLSNDTLFASADQYIFALDANTGEVLWQTLNDLTTYLQATKFVKRGDQIVAHHTNSTKAWNTVTGELEWEFPFNREEGLEPLGRGRYNVTPKGYAIPSRFNSFYIISDNGELVEHTKLDPKFNVSGIRYFENKLFVGQGQTLNGAKTIGRITALDEQTGDSLWAYDTEHNKFGTPSIIDGVLYNGTSGNSDFYLFLALDPRNGDVLWDYLSNHPLEYVSGSIISNNYVIIRSSAYMFALNRATGKKVWDFKWSSSSGVNIVEKNGFVYASNHHTIFVVDVLTGELVHEEPLPEGAGFFWDLTISDDILYALTSTKLIAYQPWHLRGDQ